LNRAFYQNPDCRYFFEVSQVADVFPPASPMNPYPRFLLAAVSSEERLIREDPFGNLFAECLELNGKNSSYGEEVTEASSLSHQPLFQIL
jgi:hypothetical protein